MEKNAKARKWPGHHRGGELVAAAGLDVFDPFGSCRFGDQLCVLSSNYSGKNQNAILESSSNVMVKVLALCIYVSGLRHFFRAER